MRNTFRAVRTRLERLFWTLIVIAGPIAAIDPVTFSDKWGG